jgi:glycosyltransferase involved in cell wall biosynthesis
VIPRRVQDYEVLIYHPLDGGHHPNFARLVATAFMSLGVQVQLATTERAERSPELSGVRVDGRPIRFLRLAPRRRSGNFSRLHEQATELRELARIRKWNRIVLPSGDGLLQMVTFLTKLGFPVLPNGLEVEALGLRGGIAYPSPLALRWRRRVSWFLAERAPASVRHHLDPVFIEWLSRRPACGPRWQLMPDPIEPASALDKRSARAHFGLPADDLVVGSVGILDERKGIHLLVEGFGRAALPKDTHLLLVGICSQAVKQRIARLVAQPGFAGRVHLDDRWVADHEMMTALAAMDLAAAVYPAHVGSASIVLRAMAAGRPVLGSPTPWIVRHISGYDAGWVADAEDREAFPVELARAVQAARDWAPSPRVHDLLAFNSPENFMAHWTRSTEVELGCASPFAWRDPPAEA